jgi:hypothetical protein
MLNFTLDLADPEIFIYKGVYLSNDYVIAWSDQICRLYDIEGNKYKTLSLALNNDDNMGFDEIL